MPAALKCAENLLRERPILAASCAINNRAGSQSTTVVGIDGKLANVLNYINTGETNDDFTAAIADKTAELSNDRGWRSGYMTYQQRMYEEQMRGFEKGKAEGIAEGKAAGIAEGKAVGIAEGKAKAFFELVQDGDMRTEVAAEKLNLPIDEFEKQMTDAGYKIPVC